MASPKGNGSQKDRCFSWFPTAPTCTTIAAVGLFPSPPVAMPSNRPNLTLDEQSFQGLLSAAFIIQEHNDRQKQARQAQAESEGGSRGLDGLRPGERLQHNWASMWLMSQ